MPPKDNIELGSGQLYFKGLDESLEVTNSEGTDEIEYYDETASHHIKGQAVDFTLELNDVEFPRGWQLAECKYCGYKFPVSDYYAILLGTTGWTCPKCTFIKRLEDARKRREK